MTVNEAITRLKQQQAEYNDKYVDFAGVNDAYNLAIRSLDAWEKVINTLKNWSDAKVSPKQRDVYFDCIKLIEQTIKQEV